MITSFIIGWVCAVPLRGIPLNLNKLEAPYADPLHGADAAKPLSFLISNQ